MEDFILEEKEIEQESLSLFEMPEFDFNIGL